MGEPACAQRVGQRIHLEHVEGFDDNHGRPIYQPLVVNQNGREILYLGNLAGNILNPLTGKVEPNGTSIIDVTDVKNPKFLFHILGPAGTVGNAGAQMVRVCGSDTLPHGEKGKWYLSRAFGNVGPDESHQVWDVTVPAAPTLITTIVSGLSRKCVCISMMNWSLSELARSSAMAGVAASAVVASKKCPKVSFMAT
jgi:hypothetical protein